MLNVAAIRSSLPSSVDRESYPSWRALTWFSMFHLCLAIGLNLARMPVVGPLWQTAPVEPLTSWVSMSYLAFTLLGLFFTRMRWPPKEHQIQTAVFIDVLAFTLLMHATGGVNSGFALMLAIVVAAGALLMEGQLSLLFAAFATLGVIAEETYSQLYQDASPEGFTRAGLLGVTYFTVAMLAHVLYRRIQETEKVAARRQVDIADLSKLNEFIIQRMDTGVLVADGERTLRVINSAAKQLLGQPLAAKGDTLDEIAPELAAWLEQHVNISERVGDTLRISDRTVTVELHLLGSFRASGALLFLRDRHELVREAQQIKLASLGRLTAGIAHNIRNPLSAVRQAGQLLDESPELTDEDRRLIHIIHRNTARIDETVESVLQLSRRHQAAPEHIDLGTWASEFCAEIREIRQLAPPRLRLDSSTEGVSVNADPRHLRQILWNLCDNALIHGSTKDRPANVLIRVGSESASGRPFVEVRDDGRGIDTETARDIFTPFFTTSVSGTGLGLYIARELSETNGIDLDCVAPAAGGCCFRLNFDATE